MRQILLALRILLTYRNGYLFLLEKLGIRKVESGTTTYVTWNGMKYITRNGTTDFAILNETTIFQEYLNESFRTLTKDSLVLDFGAQAGDFSVYTAYNKGCTVVCFEPEPENLEILKQNVAINSLGSKVTIVPKAVMSDNADKTFYASPHDNKGVHSFYYEGPKPITVQCTTPLEILESLNGRQVNLLKIDIEGGEHDIIKQEFKPFFDQVHAVVMEYHCQPHMKEAHTLEELKQTLAALGFTDTTTSGTPELGLLSAKK
ncbi:MAG: FkbM family methyltransferase [Candidatus Doudnabacteria bacterium]|nr:FkbM family methyltransferase [Candidatus Doudnabacteria bacterium]